jgi:hypothetical protein
MGDESLLQLYHDYQSYWGMKAFFRKIKKIITILLSRCIKTMKGEDRMDQKVGGQT